MSLHARRTFPLLVAGLAGLFVVAQFFIASKAIAYDASLILDWATIFAGFALCVGSTNLMVIHGRHIKRRTEKWFYSSLLLSTMGIYLAVGLALTNTSGTYRWMYDTINIPLSQVSYSLLAFYIFSAAVRAFQAKNSEATIFLVCGLLTIVGNIPSMSVYLPQLGAVGDWITAIPTKGAFRGLLITAAIGGIILGLRTLLGRESAYLGRGE